MTKREALQCLRERAAYLEQRVLAKQAVGWEFAYDARERAALVWVLACVDPAGRQDNGA